MRRAPLSSPAPTVLHGRQAAKTHLLPALTLKPTATGFDDKAGAYTGNGSSLKALDSTLRPRGKAPAVPRLPSSSSLTNVTNTALFGGAGAQLSGVLAVKSGDILRVWAGNGGVGSRWRTAALGGEGYASGDSTGSNTATGAAQVVGTDSGYVYGASGGSSSATVGNPATALITVMYCRCWRRRRS